MEHLNDEFYMQKAIQLAESTQGQTGINPAVGCVVVKNGAVVGVGAHLKRGGPHAEVHALNMAADEAEGSTVYVTLEPCSHYGKTPPCSDRLIRDKVKRVVIAAADPNPAVAGTGIQRLREHGIEVTTGLFERQASAINEKFNKYIVTGLPFVTLKTASTLDGKIASKSGDSRWISGEASRRYVHTLRHRHQAIMVGIETVLQDNPRLTARLDIPLLQPFKIVVDSRLRIPIDADVIRERPEQTIVLTTANAAGTKKRQLRSLGVEVVECGGGENVNLPYAMDWLGRHEISSILLEGGGTLNGAMLERQFIDKVILFFAPKIIGGNEAPSNFKLSGWEKMSDAMELEHIQVRQFDQDVCITGYPLYKKRNDIQE